MNQSPWNFADFPIIFQMFGISNGTWESLALEIQDFPKFQKLLKMYILAVFKIAKKLHKNYRNNTQNI